MQLDSSILTKHQQPCIGRHLGHSLARDFDHINRRGSILYGSPSAKPCEQHCNECVISVYLALLSISIELQSVRAVDPSSAVSVFYMIRVVS